MEAMIALILSPGIAIVDPNEETRDVIFGDENWRWKECGSEEGAE
jgi:hypothetical protein